MRFYPINLDLKGKTVLVVGAGSVALQKIEGLLQAEASVQVVSREACAEIRQWSHEAKVSLALKDYEKSDLKNAFLVFAATNDADTNRRIHQDGLAEKILVNAVDQPAECDFTIPARVVRGDLLIAISSGGRAPFLSKILRKYFEEKIPPQWEEIMLKLVTLREKMIQQGKGKDFAQYMNAHAGELSLKLIEHPEEFSLDEIEGDLKS